MTLTNVLLAAYILIAIAVGIGLGVLALREKSYLDDFAVSINVCMGLAWPVLVPLAAIVSLVRALAKRDKEARP